MFKCKIEAPPKEWPRLQNVSRTGGTLECEGCSVVKFEKPSQIASSNQIVNLKHLRQRMAQTTE
jgi:hypothetical protein